MNDIKIIVEGSAELLVINFALITVYKSHIAYWQHTVRIKVKKVIPIWLDVIMMCQICAFVKFQFVTSGLFSVNKCS
jgi:hypothetical protein